MISEIKALIVQNGYNAISSDCIGCNNKCENNCIAVRYAGMSYEKKAHKQITTEKVRICFIKPSTPHQYIFEVLALLQDHKGELISGDFDCIYDTSICSNVTSNYVTNISFEKEQAL